MAKKLSHHIFNAVKNVKFYCTKITLNCHNTKGYISEYLSMHWTQCLKTAQPFGFADVEITEEDEEESEAEAKNDENVCENSTAEEYGN